MSTLLPESALPLETRLAAGWPVERWRDVSVVVAVSGGPDSVALLRALVRLRPLDSPGRLIVAHLNHQLRAADSAADQRFVEDLARRLELTCVVGQAEGLARQAESMETAARAARYAFLAQTAAQAGARYVVTGHTADDQAETILHHLLRGTSLRGLAGMRRVRPMSDFVMLLRPLLEISRAEVLDYLQALDQTCRTDATNTDTELTRNRIRHELLPLLARDYNPAVVESLLRLGKLAGDTQSVVDPIASELIVTATSATPQGNTVDCRRLAGVHRHLVREMFSELWRRNGWPLQAMGFAEWDRLASLVLDAGDESYKTTLPGAIRVERSAGQLILSDTREG